MKILTVDDSMVMRKIISSAVLSIGFDCLEASNGEEALEILEKEYQNISIILVDWNMPKMNGLELVKRIQNDERYKEIPFMMVTTETERERIIEAVKAGVKNYLTKPFSQQDLATKIIETIGMEL